MRPFISIAFLALLTTAAAIPISPAAPALQRRAEQMRLEGLDEREIAEQLARPIGENDSYYHTFRSQLLERFYSLLDSELDVDFSGDIAPGSMDAPEMLPRAASPASLIETIKAFLRGEDLSRREFAYEGKELELKRPVGMRHWGS